jgi:hypothetical protein
VAISPKPTSDRNNFRSAVIRDRNEVPKGAAKTESFVLHERTSGIGHGRAMSPIALGHVLRTCYEGTDKGLATP